jgi:sugar lactone lactonase YvrE
VSVDRNGSVEILTEDVTWPNGIGVSPDAQTIYLSDYATGVVLAISAQGGDTREFCRAPRGSVDGLAVDVEGAVWVALGEGGAIARFRSDGELDEVTEVPASFVSSLAFGGADMCDVLITTADNDIRPELGGTLLRARSEVAGLPITPAVA